ncbi:polysaccharide lyase family 7 protein [Pseudomonas alkylphenolica]|uniref:Polysaccharide lyase family 7 protein n=1 Tax=Pseudomonas alkylphenolica TaxID=237609 RepID=A0A443ZHN9_9PSED|nr:polysaccharide lyase family 7 protein [Pseudomonas alkylphenolica]RWU18287.1 polysaccharide lyase family 7 protein [Pseudomonas alkylphenolica]
MTVNIDKLIITTPVATSASEPVALELTGAQALARFPKVISTLADGSVRFTAPTKGASSKSTHRTRCEWKEAQYWTLASADRHRCHQVMTLTQVNHAQKVVIAQMHVKDDDSPVLKVFWNKGKITYGFRPSFNQAAPASVTLLSNVPLNAVFAVTVQVSDAGVLTLEAKCKGISASTGSLRMNSNWKTQTFNFHGGVYNQVDYTSATAASDASVCELSTLQLLHS